LEKKDGSYAVSSENNSFINRGIEIVRDVKPGEIVFLNNEGIKEIQDLNF
jgi:glutamine phosphoribosylpyrophosphate amidotransferase|tara:strand:- start:267 stop:416 length:150 start_codon:yes stop_codon:yes gene_type:complete